ncbi:MAG TPA: hypothetical protein PKX44_01365, partial [Methanomassiliicoccaceae archaeon]|nr:hypothetical protein [Methanomassiliicoccaceae archaeon]
CLHGRWTIPLHIPHDLTCTDMIGTLIKSRLEAVERERTGAPDHAMCLSAMLTAPFIKAKAA